MINVLNYASKEKKTDDKRDQLKSITYAFLLKRFL